jgi:hypothetical protein
MIRQLSLAGYIPIAEVYSARFSGGRLEVPVRPSDAIYANFRHVVGIPVTEPGIGIPIDRLILLDRLISQLESARLGKVARPESPEKLPASEIDSLIEAYEKRLHAAARILPFAATNPYRPAVSVPSGIIVNLVA